MSRRVAAATPGSSPAFLAAANARAGLAAGRVDEARSAATAVLAGEADRPAAAGARLVLGSIELMAGRTGAALAMVEPVERDPSMPMVLVTGTELVRLYARLFDEDMARTRAIAEGILATADTPAMDPSLSAAMAALAYLSWSRADVDGARGLLAAAVVRGEGRPASARIYAMLGVASVSTSIGDAAEARVALAGAAELIQTAPAALWAAAPALFEARRHIVDGDAAGAAAEARTGLAIAGGNGTAIFEPMAHWLLASAALLKGDLATAEDETDLMRRGPAAGRAMVGGASHDLLEVRVADALGRVDSAYRGTRSLAANLRTTQRLLVDDSTAAACLVRIALAEGDRTLAAEIVGTARRVAMANVGIASLQAGADHAHGLIAADPTSLDRAARTHIRPWAIASAREDLGVCLAEASDPAAHDVFPEAQVGYSRLGATRDVDRIERRRLRLAGQHLDGAVRIPFLTGWSSLTDAERRVADVVAKGLTNGAAAKRLFVSRHTIDFHLRHVFQKLGVESRVTLARLAVERDLAEDSLQEPAVEPVQTPIPISDRGSAVGRDAISPAVLAGPVGADQLPPPVPFVVQTMPSAATRRSAS